MLIVIYMYIINLHIIILIYVYTYTTIGNKGAVCIRFEIESTSICFIASHLSAHREHIQKRNDDYYAIITSPIFQQFEYDSKNSNKNIKYTDNKLNNINKDIKNIRARLPPSVTARYLYMYTYVY